MAKLPSAFDGLAQLFCQKESVKTLDVADMRKTIGLAWEQRKGGKAPRNQAQKLSAVKRGPNEPPFEQQQGDGQRGGRRRRGNCAGCGRNQQGQGNQAQPAQQSQPQAGPSQPLPPAPPAPTLDTFQFGHIVSPVVSFPPLPSFYPSFNKALSLARRIGVTPTTQTLKRLEAIERPSDPCPLKKRSPPKEDEVSLDWSGNEDDVDVFMEESAIAGPSGTTHRYVRTKETICDSDVSTVTKKYRRNTKYLVPNTSFLVCCPLSVNEDHFEATWMLDSGASCHFTNNINDFVDYEENVGPE